MANTTPISGSAYFGQTAAKPKGTLDMGTFLNLLVVQLQNQNPLEPMDDAAFYGQMAQLGQVQGMEKLNSSADLQQAQTLLGKTVSAVRPTSSDSGKQGELFTGSVAKIVLKNGNQYLGVQEADGGIVEVEVSAVKSVLPTVDVAGMSSLIGKTVGGASGTTAVVGVVMGVTAENGQAIAQVKMGDKVYRLPVAALQQIAG